MIDYTQILIVNYPTAQWSLHGNTYDGLTWLDSSPKPTKAELDALWESTLAQAEAEKAKAIAVKESALAKLAALGLTQDEVKALVG
jgi:hypothetical protein